MKIGVLKIFVALMFAFLFLALDFERELELAERYIILNKYNDAKEVLEQLYKIKPNDARVLMNLRKVYFALKEYDKLIPIIQTELLQNPRSIELNIELGKIYLSQGKPTEARSYFLKAGTLSDNKEKTYNSIGELYLTWGYFDEGISFLLDARRDLKKGDAFALLMGDLYSFKGDFEMGLNEYLVDVSRNPADIPVIVERIKELGKSDSDLVRLKTVIIDYTKRSKNTGFLLNLLYQTELRLGNIDGAFDCLKRLEEIEPDSGRRIVEFGGSLERIRAFATLENVANHLIGKYKSGYPYLSGKFLYGIAKRGMGKPDEAIGIFNELASYSKNASPGSIERDFEDKAYLELGRTYLVSMNNPKLAIEILEPRIKGVRFWTPMLRLSALLLVDAYITDWQMDDALNLLLSLMNIFPNDDEVAFRLGEMYIFKGMPERAKSIFSSLGSSGVRSIYVNDALEYLLILSDPNGQAISEALFLGRTGKYDEAIKRLEKEERGDFKEFVLWKESLFLAEIGKTKAALEKLQQIITSSPNSFYTPLALEFQGDLLLKEGDIRGALDKYKSLLINYNRAINIDSVRDKIKEIGGTI